jgi:hypothetical protein
MISQQDEQTRHLSKEIKSSVCFHRLWFSICIASSERYLFKLLIVLCRKTNALLCIKSKRALKKNLLNDRMTFQRLKYTCNYRKYLVDLTNDQNVHKYLYSIHINNWNDSKVYVHDCLCMYLSVYFLSLECTWNYWVYVCFTFLQNAFLHCNFMTHINT